MKHFAEVLQTLGASKIEPLSETQHWDFWKAVYSTPISEVSGYYLYLKSSCPWKEGNNRANWDTWQKPSKGNYEIIVTPASDFIRKPSQTIAAFKGTRVRTSKELLLNNFVKSLTLEEIISEENFIDPTLELENGRVSQDTTHFLISWIKGRDSATKGVSIAALVADGGVGKTTVSRVLSRSLHEDDPTVIPILIESDQWRHLLNTPISLSNLWDLAISRRFQNAARLLSNEMAFRVLVREGLFVIIFDGFDELCVNSYAVSRPKEIIDELITLLSPEDEPVQAKIVLTARSTFWESLADEIELKDIETFYLRGFDNDQRKSYFDKTLTTHEERDIANRLSRQISGAMYEGIKPEDHNYERPSGVPFILSLIAQYVRGSVHLIEVNPYMADPLERLLEDICRRENLRQSLDIEPTKQLELFEELFREYQESIQLTDLQMYLDVICNINDKETANRFTNHVFLTRTEKDTFGPRYEVLRVYFIARFLAKGLLELTTKTPRQQIARLLAKNSTGKTQVIDWLILQLRNLEQTTLIRSIHHALAIIRDQDNRSTLSQSSSAIFHVVSSLISGGDKDERTRLLCDFYNIDRSGTVVFKAVVFAGVVRSFSFRDAIFEKCEFYDVEFKNCTFGDASTFRTCSFYGNLKFTNCSNAGSIKTQICTFSRESEFALDVIRNSHSRMELKRSFAEEALSRSLRKFRKDNRFIPIQYEHRKTGFKPGNPYNETVWQELERAGLIHSHHISGVTGGGLNIVDDKNVRREVSSFLDNGVLGNLLTNVLTKMIT